MQCVGSTGGTAGRAGPFARAAAVLHEAARFAACANSSASSASRPFACTVCRPAVASLAASRGDPYVWRMSREAALAGSTGVCVCVPQVCVCVCVHWHCLVGMTHTRLGMELWRA